MQGRPDIQEIWQVDGDELVSEIERYLAAVELFRAEGYEPAWSDDVATGFAPVAAEFADERISLEPDARDLV